LYGDAKATKINQLKFDGAMIQVPQEKYEKVIHSRSIDELRLAVQDIVLQLGFDGFIYLIVLDKGLQTGEPKTFTVSSYSTEFIHQYQGDHCYRFDPAVRHILEHQYPIHWGRDSFIGQSGAAMYERARGFGLRSGATFPVMPPSVTIAGFGYAVNKEIEETLPHIIETMPFGQLLATYTHTAVTRLLVEKLENIRALTRREELCLTLAAQGYRDGEIATMLAISTRTVLFHLSNAKSKLGAENRAQMIAKAVFNKLIQI
jgi:DNA-binding CsgD family transcriptional regulator